MANRIPTPILWMLIITAFTITGCGQTPIVSTPTQIPAPMEEATPPTPAVTLLELVRNISDNNMAVRLVSIYELDKYGKGAVIAIPALIDNLNVDYSEVQVAAIIALGHLGPDAQDAIPGLVDRLHNDGDIHVKSAAATALGFIGDEAIVPDLAAALFEDNPPYDVAISCARSLAIITGEKFTDFDSETGYSIDKDGVPFIVIDARKWWLETGQYHNWSSK